MAAKLILSMDGSVLQEYVLSKERMTVGRKPHNDIVIENLAISGEHAAIVTILNDSFLEDLDSTNGVMVNGTQVKKHFLQNNDVIEIGKYKLKYLNEVQHQANGADFEKTMVLRTPSAAPAADNKTLAQSEPGIAPAQTAGNPAGAANVAAKKTGDATVVQKMVPPAAVQILTGANTGRELDLVKNLTTLGKPGVQVAVLTRRPHGYFITHVEGANYPSLNGRALDEQPHPLNNHDIIELAGIKMEFYFKD
ncbi:MAG: FHA domain-containing protein [Nitrosomonadales bacterium]|nr:FHA domain-containing protein [Nitrosomonadales bacterium]